MKEKHMYTIRKINNNINDITNSINGITINNY